MRGARTKRPADLPFAPADPALASRFWRTVEESMKSAPLQGSAGVGTLQEKRMHAIIKRFLFPDEDYHEVGIDADCRYVADVRIGDEIYEVQTGSLLPLRKKLEYYLAHTDCRVTVVHPMTYTGHITRLDPKSGQVLSRRKTPICETPLSFLPELYPLRDLLGSDRLAFRLLFFDVEEFRTPKARRGQSDKLDRVPASLLGEYTFASRADYKALLPDDVENAFAAKDFAAKTGLSGIALYSALHTLSAVGVLDETPGKPITFRVL